MDLPSRLGATCRPTSTHIRHCNERRVSKAQADLYVEQVAGRIMIRPFPAIRDALFPDGRGESESLGIVHIEHLRLSLFLRSAVSCFPTGGASGCQSPISLHELHKVLRPRD